ncbi:MAG: hypothetical protein J6B26_08815 [Agathobacter sp.]|nr:hypothetical protein [Agathobacter sp.]MBQ2283110.1 hypothetical protein [Agathobacter sp.]
MLKRINDALPGLVLGILIWGVLVQFTGVWFVEDKLRYSVGLWFGIAVAIGMAINLAVVIYDSVSIGEAENANRRIVAKSVLRYAIVVILFFILGYFNLGNLFTAFLGVLGLKMSAYMQPLFERFSNKLSGRTDAASCEDNSENSDKEVTL